MVISPTHKRTEGRAPVWAGLLKTKNRFYLKGSEQCIKRVLFPPGYAELEPIASYLASSSARQRYFLIA